MRVALGFKTHSGWAALVAVGAAGSEFTIVDRRRIELVEIHDADWAGQPYHAADGLPAKSAAEVVERGIVHARRCATLELRAVIGRLHDAGHTVAACAIVMPPPMPDWTIEQILAVHIRMHKAEGVLYPQALANAATACRLKLLEVAEKELDSRAAKALALSPRVLAAKVARLGKALGPPWGADQKRAALAALLALAETRRR